MARLLARAESTRSDTKSMSEGQCQHISAVGFGRPLPGARGNQKAPEGGVPRPRAPRLVAVPRPVLCFSAYGRPQPERRDRVRRAEPHPQ